MLWRMATMTHRLQLLIDEERFGLLERESRRSGRPIAELIREAVDARYGIDVAARRAAYEQLVAAEPMPVDDWDVMKQELLDTFYDDRPT